MTDIKRHWLEEQKKLDILVMIELAKGKGVGDTSFAGAGDGNRRVIYKAINEMLRRHEEGILAYFHLRVDNGIV